MFSSLFFDMKKPFVRYIKGGGCSHFLLSIFATDKQGEEHMPSHDTDKLALFVDMDNLSVTRLETVLSRWRCRQTTLTLRRAYGGLDKLKGAAAVLQRHGFHVRANHGKGTTDVLLTMDVMDALHAGLLPPVVAIVARPCVRSTWSVAASPCTRISVRLPGCFRSCPARVRHAWSSC